MRFDWLKQYMPRTLFGRSLVILLFPVILLELLVGYAFIERHYTEVTRQLSNSVALEINFLLGQPDATLDGVRETASALGLVVTAATPADMPQSRRRFYDISAGVASEALSRSLPAPLSLDWTREPGVLFLTLPYRDEFLEFRINRSRLNASNPHQLLVLMVVGSVVFVLISVGFLRNQIRPIRRLAAAAHAFGRGRKVDFSPRGATESRLAGQAFLDMRNRIERQIEQRTIMLSGVSHDLRTPLTRMKLSLELMDDQAEADALREDIRAMENILNSFLDYAGADVQNERAATDLAELVRACVERNPHAAHITLVSEGEPCKPVLNETMITRAVENLIGNAMRYGTHAEVRVSLAPDRAEITVEDDGPGIPEDQLSKAQQPFVRLDASRNPRTGGVGLGLSIVADAARSHGGRLHLSRSEKLGGLKATMFLAF